MVALVVLALAWLISRATRPVLRRVLRGTRQRDECIRPHPSLDDSWTNLTVRYLVGARERRRWQLQFIGPDGKATRADWMED